MRRPRRSFLARAAIRTCCFDAGHFVFAEAPETVEGLVAAAESAGVKRIAFFANSKGGDQTETALAVRALAQAHPDLFVLGAPKIGFITTGDLPRGFIGETVTGVRNSSSRPSTYRC
jgi:hypothetical protein